MSYRFKNDLITPNYVYENTKFSLDDLLRFTFFNFTQTGPINELINSIRELNVREVNDFGTLLSYNVQYIITIKETFEPGGVNN